MSDTSDDEDLSRFREAVDCSFTKLIDQSRGKIPDETNNEKEVEKPKSERYLEEAGHYNDVKVPAEMQKRIGAKISAIIEKKVEFVEITQKKNKELKFDGGIRLFKDSKEYLSYEEPVDNYTEGHNADAKKRRKKKRKIDDVEDCNDRDKITSVVVSGEYVLSKEETKLWKSRRKEKVFKYKSDSKKSKILTAIE